MRHLYPRLSFWTMVALSFGTGALDAATYLGMGNVFGANMTGNVILVGLSLAGNSQVPLIGPLASLSGFAAGSWLLGLILRRFPASSHSDKALVAVLWVTALGMLGIAVALLLLPDQIKVVHGVTLAIGMLMAFQAIAARRVGVPGVSTVVITSTLSLLLSEAGEFHGGATTKTTMTRLAAVMSMFLGAIAGAALLHLGLWVPLLAAAVILLGVAITVNTCWSIQKKRTRAANVLTPA